MLTSEQRAQRHILPLVQCPPVEKFRALIACCAPSFASDSSSSSASVSASTASAAAAAPPPSVSAEATLALLTSMADWSAELFLVHDRAAAAHALYEDVLSAVRAQQARAVSPDAEQEEWDAVSPAGEEPGGPAPADSLGELSVRLQSTYPFTLISRVGAELGELTRICAPEHPDASWTVLDPGTEGDKIATYYRREAEGGTHSFLVSGEVQAPMLNLVAMLREASLLYKWLPAVTESTQLSSLDNSRYRMLLRVIVQAIWPVADREAMLLAYGDIVDGGDNGDEGQVAIYFRSVDEREVFPKAGPDSQDVTVPPVKDGCVRVDVKVGGFTFKPLSATTTRVRALFNLDPKLFLIPHWFLNIMSKSFCATIVQLMRDKAPRLFNGHTAYAQAMEQQGRVYDEIKRRIAELHEQHGHQAMAAAANDNASADGAAGDAGTVGAAAGPGGAAPGGP